MTVVKICGITRLEDGLAAATAGADLLGFNFYSGSARCVSLQRAGDQLHLGVKRPHLRQRVIPVLVEILRPRVLPFVLLQLLQRHLKDRHLILRSLNLSRFLGGLPFTRHSPFGRAREPT